LLCVAIIQPADAQVTLCRLCALDKASAIGELQPTIHGSMVMDRQRATKAQQATSAWRRQSHFMKRHLAEGHAAGKTHAVLVSREGANFNLKLKERLSSATNMPTAFEHWL
jgi:hypothetical protein